MGIFKKKNNEPDDYFSKDADQTRYLYMAFILAMSTIIGLFALELSPSTTPPDIFTPEINHILVNGILIGFIGIGAYLYGKQSGASEALAKIAGGGNGEKKQENQQS